MLVRAWYEARAIRPGVVVDDGIERDGALDDGDSDIELRDERRTLLVVARHQADARHPGHARPEQVRRVFLAREVLLEPGLERLLVSLGLVEAGVASARSCKP